MSKTIVFWVFILLCLMLLWGVVQRNARNASMAKVMEISYSDLFTKVQSGEVLDAVIQSDDLNGHLKASPKGEFHTTLPANYDDLTRAMIAAKVNLTIKAPQRHFLAPLLINIGPFIILALGSVLIVPPFWVLFRKVGFQPALSILMLFPAVNLILLYVVAFSRRRNGGPRPA